MKGELESEVQRLKDEIDEIDEEYRTAVFQRCILLRSQKKAKAMIATKEKVLEELEANSKLLQAKYDNIKATHTNTNSSEVRRIEPQNTASIKSIKNKLSEKKSSIHSMYAH